MDQRGIVIVGTGLAGYGTAREFRKWDKAAPLTLITAGDGAYYPKPQLSAAMASGKAPAQLALKDATAMASELGAEVMPFTTVVKADIASRILTLSSGREIPFGKLVLAVGARTREAQIHLSDGARLRSVNDLAQYAAFRAAVPAGGRLLILGSGLIGCEFAHDFAASGHKVTVLGNGTGPLSNLLPPGLSQGLRAALERLGVEFRFGDALVGLEGREGAMRARLASAHSLAVDAALSAIGFDADMGLAKALGLRTRIGIVVDASLRASHPDVFAIGDCAEIAGRWLPFVQPLTLAAKALGQVLAGKDAVVEFPPMPVVVKTPSYPLAVLPPPQGAPGRWIEYTGPQGGVARFEDERGNSRGFAAAGDRFGERSALVKSVLP